MSVCVRACSCLCIQTRCVCVWVRERTHSIFGCNIYTSCPRVRFLFVSHLVGCVSQRPRSKPNNQREQTKCIMRRATVAPAGEQAHLIEFGVYVWIMMNTESA